MDKFRCNCCLATFSEPARYKEYHCGPHAPAEIWAVCPECGSADIEENESEEE